jgi:hypothetical protein
MQRLMGGQTAVDAAEVQENAQKEQKAREQAAMIAAMNQERESKDAALKEQTMALLAATEQKMLAMKEAMGDVYGARFSTETRARGVPLSFTTLLRLKRCHACYQ